MKTRLPILTLINKKNRIIRLIAFILACFLAALNYNLFFIPNNLVVGGVSGLAIVVNEVSGLSRILFLNLATIALFVLSLFLLDKKETFKSLFGSLIFNFMVIVTLPISQMITINISSAFMMIFLSAVIAGIGSGTIYKSGFNTGGSDIIINIIHKYLKMPMGKASTLINIFIIGSGFLVFGPTNTLYALFILIVANYITDYILLGIKDSKMCYIKSSKLSDISDCLMNNMNIGITEIASKGGVFSKKDPVLFVIVPSDKYYEFKYLINKIDNKVFILTINCYGVTGGYKKRLIPF